MVVNPAIGFIYVWTEVRSPHLTYIDQPRYLCAVYTRMITATPSDLLFSSSLSYEIRFECNSMNMKEEKEMSFPKIRRLKDMRLEPKAKLILYRE